LGHDFLTLVGTAGVAAGVAGSSGMAGAIGAPHVSQKSSVAD
jgi:hypothetical protein